MDVENSVCETAGTVVRVVYSMPFDNNVRVGGDGAEPTSGDRGEGGLVSYAVQCQRRHVGRSRTHVYAGFERVQVEVGLIATSSSSSRSRCVIVAACRISKRRKAKNATMSNLLPHRARKGKGGRVARTRCARGLEPVWAVEDRQEILVVHYVRELA
jgi:hypothetical protein